jgi:hypothetical protein
MARRPLPAPPSRPGRSTRLGRAFGFWAATLAAVVSVTALRAHDGQAALAAGAALLLAYLGVLRLLKRGHLDRLIVAPTSFAASRSTMHGEPPDER